MLLAQASAPCLSTGIGMMLVPGTAVELNAALLPSHIIFKTQLGLPPFFVAAAQVFNDADLQCCHASRDSMNKHFILVVWHSIVVGDRVADFFRLCQY